MYLAAPEPCGAEGLGTDLGTAVRHAESRLAAMRTALDMISRGAGFSWQPRGLLQGRGGPNARTGRARAPRSAIHAFCHCLLILVELRGPFLAYGRTALRVHAKTVFWYFVQGVLRSTVGSYLILVISNSYSSRSTVRE